MYVCVPECQRSTREMARERERGGGGTKEYSTSVNNNIEYFVCIAYTRCISGSGIRQPSLHCIVMNILDGDAVWRQTRARTATGT